MFVRIRRSAVLCLALAAAACATSEGGGGGDPDTPGGPTIEHPRTLLGLKDTALASQGNALSPAAAAGVSSSALSIWPFGAAVNRDGIAYLTLHGDIDAIVRWDFEARTFKDGVTFTGDEPTNVSFSPDGKTAYVASQLSQRVDIVNVANDSIIGSAATPDNDPYQTTVNPDGSRFYASGNGDRIWVFNAATRAVVDTIPVDADPNGMVITRDGKWMFITHLSSGTIGRITLATGVYDTLATVGATPVHGLDVSPDGTRLYLVSQGTDSLYAFNTTTGANEGQVYAGDEAFGLGATPDGTEIWVTSYTGELRRFHSEDLSVITTLVLGGHLRRLAIDPAGRGAVIADEDGYIIIIK
jgi:DNA-binding beta-propeller fold protein YncE